MDENNQLQQIYDVSLFNISDLDVLLHETLKHLRVLLKAEAGTIYIKKENTLNFHIFQNDKLSYEDIYKQHYFQKDLQLPIDSINKYLSVDSLITKKIIMVDDVYNSHKYDFLGTKEFDEKFNYKTHSILSIPLIHPINNDILGVIQLINKKENGQIIPFNSNDKEIISMLSSFIALSISKAQYDLKKLEAINEELKKANINLEKRVKEEVSNNQQKSAVILHQSKMTLMGEVLSNIAHQWRQPLSTISTLASGLSLELELDKISKAEAQEQLKKIVQTTQDLSEMIDDFRNFYNIDARKEEFYLSDGVEKSLELAEVILSDHKIETVLNVEVNIKVYGLKNEFIQAILNIISGIKDEALNEENKEVKKYIFIDIFMHKNKKYLKIKSNFSNTDFSNIDLSNENKLNMSLYMTNFIIKEHFNGKLKYENIKFSYKEKDYNSQEYTIIFPSPS